MYHNGRIVRFGKPKKEKHPFLLGSIPHPEVETQRSYLSFCPCGFSFRPGISLLGIPTVLRRRLENVRLSCSIMGFEVNIQLWVCDLDAFFFKLSIDHLIYFRNG